MYIFPKRKSINSFDLGNDYKKIKIKIKVCVSEITFPCVFITWS